MQRVSSTSTIWRTIASNARILFLFNDPSAHSFSTVSIGVTSRKLHQPEIPCDFLKWGSIGFCRTSRFATGFNPLKQKPLDSIVDVERLKDRYPEDIASIWDDFGYDVQGRR
ncbi:hypothetical protein TSUD_42610 [Trifolium subterraneum]|uniref:Uncharacterized protein n=1 Tax=Trifolium subterraneum TaxID=3900 RepID=A0A2Z6M3C4_TRISU|nr:hypothetical protein TSUD_42610 [Trifolium subterraneum]